MKQPKPSGRLIANIGDEALKREFYQILCKRGITFTDWLKDKVQSYVNKWNSEVK